MMAAHFPSEAPVFEPTQATQEPPQTLSQQTESAHTPEPHWAAVAQPWPRTFLATHSLPAQYAVSTQSLFTSQVALQAVPPQR